MKLGQTLKILRVASGLRQATLAKELEVTPNYLSLVENDRREPSLAFLKKFAIRLDVPLGYFLWLALGNTGSEEEVDLRDKMDALLTELLRDKRNEEKARK